MKKLTLILWACIAAGCSDRIATPPVPATQKDFTDDLTPPVILGASVDPAEVNVTTAEQPIHATIQIADDRSGVAYCWLAFSSPSHQQTWGFFFSSATSLTSGDANAGVMETTSLFAQYREPGLWTLSSAHCEDRVGNRVDYGADNPWPYAPLSYNVVSVYDGQAPQVLSAAIAPASVDVSTTDGIFTFTLAFDEDVSGLSSCSAQFTSPSGEHTFSAYATPNDLVSGDALGGTLQRNGLVPVHSEPGTWTMTALTCTDRAYNSVTYGPGNPPPNPLQLDVTGQLDSAPPVVSNFYVTPQTVDASASEVLLTMHLDFTDDGSGLSQCWASFGSPSGAQQKSFYASLNQLVSGTANAGRLENNALLPQYSELGTWTLQTLSCVDAAGNRVDYDAAHPPSFGLPTFVVGLPSPTKLLDDLGVLVDQLNLPNGLRQSLQAKLAATRAAFERGQPETARNQLNAFGNEVTALQRSGRISSQTAITLADFVSRIMAALANG